MAMYTSLVLVITRSPLTWISAVSASTLSPRVAFRPSTVTRPAAISSSQARRDPIPAAASTFCSLCTSSLGIRDLIHVVGQERGQRRQLVDAVEPQLLQEQRGRPVQERAAVRLAAALLDETPCEQGTHDAVAVHAPDGRDPASRDGLLI